MRGRPKLQISSCRSWDTCNAERPIAVRAAHVSGAGRVEPEWYPDSAPQTCHSQMLRDKIFVPYSGDVMRALDVFIVRSHSNSIRPVMSKECFDALPDCEDAARLFDQ
jgi:hypothetical protein